MPDDRLVLLLDRCPPPPLVLADELCLPAGAPLGGALHVLGDVHVVARRVDVTHRAAALALLLPVGHGVVVRATAAWVWSGHPALQPSRADVALPPSAPALPGPRPGPGRPGLVVRRTRWSTGQDWVAVGGLALTDPVTTALDCARLLPPPTARRCLSALLARPGLDLRTLSRLLAPRGAQARAPGTAAALALVAELQQPEDVGGGAGQSPATSRCTPEVTR